MNRPRALFQIGLRILVSWILLGAAVTEAATTTDDGQALAPLDLSDAQRALARRVQGTSTDDLDQASTLLQALARTPWKAATLAEHMAPPKSLAVNQRLANIAADLERRPKDCAVAQDFLTKYMAALNRGEVRAAPFDRNFVERACQLHPAKLAELDAVRFVTVVSAPDEQAKVLVLGATPALATPVTFPLAGASLHVAAVPVYSQVLVTVAPAAAHPIPIIRAAHVLSVDDDQPVTFQRPACLDLSRLSMSQGGRLFVNGVAVPPGTPKVVILGPESGADIQVIGRAGKRTFRRSLPDKRLVGSTSCIAVDGDATESAKKTVLLMVTSNGSSCADLAVDPLKIRAQVRELLDKADGIYETRGVEVIDALRTITDFQTLMRSFGGGDGALTPSPKPEGNSDIARALQDIGFSIALSVDVRCVWIPGDEIRYTVVGQRVDIDRLLDASERTDRQGRMTAMSDFLASQMETQAGDQNLRGLLHATVGKLFGFPYLRVAEAPVGTKQNPNIKFEVEAGLAETAGASLDTKLAAKMTATLVSDTGVQDCANFLDLNAVRSTDADVEVRSPGNVSWSRTVNAPFRRSLATGGASASPSPAGLKLASFEIPFYPVEPGQYVVEIAIEQTNPPLKVYRCLTIKEPQHMAWVEVDDLIGLQHGRDWQNRIGTQAYVLGGLVHHTTEAYSIGALVGFGYAHYAAVGPPNWADIAHSVRAGPMAPPANSVPFAADGTVDLTWNKVSLAACLQFEKRLFRLATLFPGLQETMFRASAFYLEAMPMVDLGWYSTGPWPSGLTEQSGGPQRFDVDGSLLFSFLFKANLSDGQTLAVGFRAAWLGFDDLGRQEARKQARITYDNSVALGVQAAFGWHP